MKHPLNFLFFIVAFLLISLSTLAPTKLFADTKAAVSEDKTPIGLILPLSGPLASYGAAFQNGINMAQENNPNHNCNYTYEDSQYDPKTAVAALQKLSQNQKPNLIYNFGGPTTDAIAPLTEKKKIVLVNSEIDPNFSIGRRYVVRFSNTAKESGKKLVEKFYQERIKKIGMIRVENQFINPAQFKLSQK